MTKHEYMKEVKNLNAQIIERTRAAAKVEIVFGSNDQLVKKYWEEVEGLKQQKQHAQRMAQLHPKTRAKLEQDFANS